MDNVIGRSGQGWKFTLGWLLVLGAGLLLLVSSAPHDAADGFAAAAAGAMVASIAVAVAVTLSLRCPDCRARWIWIALSRQDHNAWVGWLRTLQACPVCGYRGPAEAREDGVPPLPKRPLFTDWRNLGRDEILITIFFVPAIVVGAVVLEGGPWTTAFWVCCAVVVLCLALARRPAVLPAAVASYCIGVFALYTILTWRLDALLGTAVCAGIIALAHWWTERPERRAASAFVVDRRCPGCSRALVARRVSRPVLSEEPSPDHWLHHCDCGELTLYKPDGSAHRVYDLHRPSESSGPS